MTTLRRRILRPLQEAVPADPRHQARLQKKREQLAKKLVRNNLPSLTGFGKGAVVPLRQVVVEEDFHGVFEVGCVLAAGGVDLSKRLSGK